MKLILNLFLNLFFISTAFAGEFTNYSKVLFQAASTWVPANRVCVQGNNLYHRHRDYVEMVRCTGVENDNCEVWDRIPLIQPIESMRLRCSYYLENECVQTERVNLNQELNVIVDIYHSHGEYQRREEPVRQDWFRITGCN